MAISHIFTNAVADATGTMTVWYGATTVTVAATDVVRPSDWNSAHYQYLSATGNTAGQSTFSGTNIVFGGGPNVTLSGVNATRIDISAAAGGGGGSLNISAGTTSNNLTNVTFANSNGISFGLDASTVTASYTVPTVTNSSWTVSDNGTSGTVARLAFTNLNGVTLSLSTGAGGSHTIVGSHNALTSQSNQAVSAANGSYAFQTLSFSNTNGVSFGTSAGSAITASVAAQTNQTGGIYVTAQSTGQSSSSTYDVRTLSFVPDGIISAGWSNGSFRVSATQSNQNVTAGNGGFAFQTLSFSNANGVSFGTSAGSAITASYTRNAASNAIASVGSATNSGTNTSRFAADDHVHAGVFSIGVSNVGNSAGDTRVDVGRFVLAGGANITLSQATAANALNTISIVGAAGGGGETRLTAYAVSNTTQSTSGTIPLSSLQFQGAGIASVGVSNGSVIVSVPAGGGAGDGGVFAGVSTGGNTAGSTGTVSTGNFVLVGSNGITLSQSTAGAGSHATVTILGNAPATLSQYRHPIVTNSAAATNQVSYAVPFSLPAYGSFSYFRFMGSFTTNSTTIATTAASLSASAEVYTTYNVVIYSHGTGANSLSLQSVASGSAGWTMQNSISVAANGTQYSVTQAISGNALGAGTTRTTQYSISNTNYSLTTNQILTEWSGPRFIDIPLNASFTPGNYFAVFGMTTSSATNSSGFRSATACRIFQSNIYGATNTNTAIGVMGSTNFTSNGWAIGAGSFTTVGNGTTASLPLSAISTIASNFVPAFLMVKQG